MTIALRSPSARLRAVVLLAATVASGCGHGEGGETDFGPFAGATLAVVGVEHDATLPLRSSPGPDQPEVASLGPLTDDLVATGKSRDVDSSIWYEVSVVGVTGWADADHLAYLGATFDATARIFENLGTRPTADSMLELGRIVAQAHPGVEATEAPPPYRMTVTVAPTQSELGEVTYDILGFQDDSVAGERLHVLATPGEKFTLESVEATTICRRGVTNDSQRLCV